MSRRFAIRRLVRRLAIAWRTTAQRRARFGRVERTRTGSEVDFVVYGDNGYRAIEVKNTARLRPADARGLRTFVSDYPECRPLLLYRGHESLDMSGIRCVPVDRFLRQLHPQAPLDGH